MGWIRICLVFASGLAVGLVVHSTPSSEQALADRALKRQRRLTLEAASSYRREPCYPTARKLVLHLSAQQCLEERAEEAGVAIPASTPGVDAMHVALHAAKLARSADERAEAERLISRAEQAAPAPTAE